jgi:sugar lactone lactonase YvrE
LCPEALYVYDDHTIYIADRYNHRIVEWRCGEKNGRVVAGGNRLGKSNKQLDNPTDVLVDKKSDSLIISDWMNRRVMQWPRQNGKNGEIIIPDIECWGLAMDKNGYLYVSDTEKHEVRRWKIGDTNGTIVAGGNGNGNHLNQLNSPSYIFVDEDYSVYVSDSNNYRVMKWMKDAKEGIVVAGGNGDRNNPRQLFSVRGVTVDRLDQIYVADRDNHRVMRWCKGATHGTVVLGGNREGAQSNLFNRPIGLSFDRQGNLYVADSRNYRIQKFEIDLNDNC